VKFVAKKKFMTTYYFSPLSFVAVFGSGIRDSGSGMGKNQDPGSGMGKNQDPGSKINIPDPQHWSPATTGIPRTVGLLGRAGVLLKSNRKDPVKNYANYRTGYPGTVLA
jgi:hypothetical protein